MNAAVGLARLRGFQTVTSLHLALLLHRWGFRRRPEIVHLREVLISGRRVNCEQPRRLARCVAERVGNPRWHQDEGPRRSTNNVVADMEFELSLEHIESLGPVVPMSWCHPDPGRHFSFEEAERATGVVAERLERDDAASHRIPRSLAATQHEPHRETLYHYGGRLDHLNRSLWRGEHLPASGSQ